MNGRSQQQALWTPDIQDHFEEDAEVIILCGDASQTLKTVPDESTKLIITSPPYNLGKVYEQATALDEYLDQLQPILEQLVRVLSPEGSLCWQVGNYVEKGEVFPLDNYYYPVFKALGFKLRNRIVWHFEHGLHSTKRLSGRYEVLLWFTKGDNYTFNLDAIRVPSKYPGKTHFKGPKARKAIGQSSWKEPVRLLDPHCARVGGGNLEYPERQGESPRKDAPPLPVSHRTRGTLRSCLDE